MADCPARIINPEEMPLGVNPAPATLTPEIVRVQGIGKGCAQRRFTVYANALKFSAGTLESAPE